MVAEGYTAMNEASVGVANGRERFVLFIVELYARSVRTCEYHIICDRFILSNKLWVLTVRSAVHGCASDFVLTTTMHSTHSYNRPPAHLSSITMSPQDVLRNGAAISPLLCPFKALRAILTTLSHETGAFAAHRRSTPGQKARPGYIAILKPVAAG